MLFEFVLTERTLKSLKSFKRTFFDVEPISSSSFSFFNFFIKNLSKRFSARRMCSTVLLAHCVQHIKSLREKLRNFGQLADSNCFQTLSSIDSFRAHHFETHFQLADYVNDRNNSFEFTAMNLRDWFNWNFERTFADHSTQTERVNLNARY